MHAIFFDATGDGNLDLYVVSGGGQLFQSGVAHRDRLYINDGSGEFTKSSDGPARPSGKWKCGSVASDYDGDGDTDFLWVDDQSHGTMVSHLSTQYSKTMAPVSFTDVTSMLAPGLEDIRNDYRCDSGQIIRVMECLTWS